MFQEIKIYKFGIKDNNPLPIKIWTFVTGDGNPAKKWADSIADFLHCGFGFRIRIPILIT